MREGGERSAKTRIPYNQRTTFVPIRGDGGRWSLRRGGEAVAAEFRRPPPAISCIISPAMDVPFDRELGLPHRFSAVDAN